MPDYCKHGLRLGGDCIKCKFGTDDSLTAERAEAKESLVDDPLAAAIADALLVAAGMPYLDGITPEEAARIAATAARTVFEET